MNSPVKTLKTGAIFLTPERDNLIEFENPKSERLRFRYFVVESKKRHIQFHADTKNKALELSTEGVKKWHQVELQDSNTSKLHLHSSNAVMCMLYVVESLSN